MSFAVLEPGLASRIVDAGRPRSRSLGVPVGGAADRVSLALGNSLIGNFTDAPALEVALKGPRLRAQSDIGCVLFGAPFEMECAGVPVEVGCTFTVREGEEIRIGATRAGVRAYLCVRGGFQTSTVLDSCSALDPVRRGEMLVCQSSWILGRRCPELLQAFPSLGDMREPAAWSSFAPHPWTILVLPGPQADWFDDTKFYESSFAVSHASNRMGLRLEGEPLSRPSREMISEPVAPGAVQVTNEGQCIILGIDGQTIGGYPKIAHVIQADLHRLGQMAPGQPLAFRKVSMSEAVARSRQCQILLRQWAARLRLSLDAFPAERRFVTS